MQLIKPLELLYIDDQIDPALGKYLDGYSSEGYDITFQEIQFIPECGYESLIDNPKVKAANIIFVDSRLFENRNAQQGKFTGEEFKLILKKYYPFIEVIVITQNDADSELGIIQKYSTRDDGQTPSEYYEKLLPQYIEEALRSLEQIWKVAKKIEQNRDLDQVLKEKILDLTKGIKVYDEFSKSDIDRLIAAFKEIQAGLEK